MKKIYTLSIAIFLLINAHAQILVSEIHYDNAGPDANESIEVYGQAGFDLTGWTLVRYDGATGASYGTDALVGTIPNLCTSGGSPYGVLVLNYPADALEDGPDGFALVDAGGTVIEFFHYEGSSFVAIDGPASGMSSSDMGVSESGAGTSAGSIQRTSIGNTWIVDDNAKAYITGSGGRIEWSNLTEAGIISYSVERSANGYSFSAIGNVSAKLNNGSRADYIFTDTKPTEGMNYYRVVSADVNGGIRYSSIVKINSKKGKAEIIVYSNPLTNKRLIFSTAGFPDGKYMLNVINTAGQVLYSKSFNYTGTSVTETVDLPAALNRGMYNLQLIGKDIKSSKTFLLAGDN